MTDNLSKEKLIQIKKRFCLDVVDSMDIDTLIEIVYDQLYSSYEQYDEKDMMFEVTDFYNDNGEEYNNLLREVSAKNINYAGTTI
jgi:tetrahydromethanopterin S-methyltransferase subunit A